MHHVHLRPPLPRCNVHLRLCVLQVVVSKEGSGVGRSPFISTFGHCWSSLGTRHPLAAPYIRHSMRRLLFLLTLMLYGFSAMDLHEWLRVPMVVVHLLEHHSGLGQHDAEGSKHGHDGDHDHTPFDADCHGEFCACSGTFALTTEQRVSLISTVPLTTILEVVEQSIASGAFTGGVWNPPKA